ncbi:MAG TPA: hypothetical protein VNW99_08085 [Cytophagaceae bacterium]|jgi:hypothetical protein|nr:hypothetical protein [Cytophagaceae bacterium]
MKNINIYNAWLKLMKTVHHVKRNNNQVNWSREQVILIGLERKLGKTEEQVNSLVSKDLLALLTMVPFTRA